MKYFIAYLLSGEVKTAHEALTNEITDRFGVFRLNDHIPPHVTLKSPFETDHIDDVEKTLSSFADHYPRAEMRLWGFGAFGREVLYIPVLASQEARSTIHHFTKVLRTIQWMQFEEFDIEKKLHATVAHRGIEEKFDEIWNFLSTQKFEFSVELDNVSILKKERDRWAVHQTYPLV